MNNDHVRTSADSQSLLEEAETLIWALLDDRLEDADSTRLCQLLETNADVRARYVDCVQLHVDLREHFGSPPERPESQPAVSPILANLGFGDLPGAGSLPTLL